MFGLSGRELRFALVISVTHLVQHFLLRLVPPLIPVLSVALAYPLWKLGVLISVFSLGSGLGQAPAGILSDRYDRRYILPTGITVAGACYILFAVAPSIGVAVPGITVFGDTFEGYFLVMSFAMFGCGLSAAVVHPTSYPMITANVSKENKGKVLGAFGSFSKLGDASASAVVGVLILVLVWDQILAILGFAVVAFGLILYLVLRGDEFETIPDDFSDAECTADSEPSPKTDRRTYAYPMLVIYLFFVSKTFAGKGVNTFIPAFVVGVYAYSFQILDVAFAPESVANFYFTALLVFAAGTQLVLGGLTDRYDARVVILACVSVATLGLLGLGLLDLSPILLMIIMFVLGAGLWGLNPARDALISEISPPEREGRTFGYLWTAVQLSGAVVPILIGYLLETAGMRQGFILLAGSTALAGVAISLLFTDRIYLAGGESSVKTESMD